MHHLNGKLCYAETTTIADCANAKNRGPKQTNCSIIFSRLTLLYLLGTEEYCCSYPVISFSKYNTENASNLMKRSPNRVCVWVLPTLECQNNLQLLCVKELVILECRAVFN